LVAQVLHSLHEAGYSYSEERLAQGASDARFSYSWYVSMIKRDRSPFSLRLSFVHSTMKRYDRCHWSI
jgi:hypothetical protein